MVKVLLYGIARLKFETKELNIEAKTIKELLIKIGELKSIKFKEMKNFLIYVNDVNITSLNMYKTKLHDKDIVMLLSPSSGG